MKKWNDNMFVDAVRMKENPFWNVSCYVNQDYGKTWNENLISTCHIRLQKHENQCLRCDSYDSDKILGNNNCMTTGSSS